MSSATAVVTSLVVSRQRIGEPEGSPLSDLLGKRALNVGLQQARRDGTI